MAEQIGASRGRQTEENFLKTILVLQRRHGVVTAGDLETVLSSSISTVYNTIHKLAGEGFILATRGTRGKKPSIELTDEGKVIAERIFQRHQQIQDWLMLLGTPEEEAEAEACLFEHGLSDTTMEMITRHVEMAKANFGMSASYPEKMMKMAQAMTHMQSHKTGLTETDKMVEAVTKHGGYETLIRRSDLVDQLGGEEALFKKQQEVQALGGLAEIQKVKQELDGIGGLDSVRHMVSALESLGGLEGLFVLERTIAQLGGLNRLKRTMDMYESLGDPKTIKEHMATLNGLEQLGGLKEVSRKLNIVASLGGLDTISKTCKKLEKIQRLLGDS